MKVKKCGSLEEALKYMLQKIAEDLQEICDHNVPPKTKIVSVTATCETTVTVCGWCGKQLDEPKTEC